MAKGKPKSKHTNKRTELEMARDRELISRLRLMRLSITEISKHEDLQHISYDQVYYDLKKLEKEWQKKAEENIDLYKQKQLKAIDTVISEAFNSWEKSKKPKMKRMYKDKTVEQIKDNKVKLDISFEHGVGDSNHLKQVLKGISEQNKMLGLYSIASSDGDKGALDQLVEAMDASYRFYNKEKENDD